MTSLQASGLATEWLTIETPDGPMRAYQVTPHRDNAPEQRAAVIVLQEAFGVNEHIQDVTRRFASQGYLAVAPDLFHRSGVKAVDYADRDQAMALIGGLGPDPIITDVAAVVTHLSEAEEISSSRTALVGFCFGGRAAFTAATALDVGATVVFYGPGIANGPHAVLDRAGSIKSPVLMFVGDSDPTITAEHVAAIQSASTSMSSELRVETFTGAGHAFFCDARPQAYVAEAAQRAWSDTTEFLARGLSRSGHESH